MLGSIAARGRRDICARACQPGGVSTPTPEAPVAHPAADPAAPSFASLGLRPELVNALTALGYEEPTPIQKEAIPPVLAGRDLLGQAATGTGKTAAFALPILERLAEQPRTGAPMALVLVPTRELAVQVSEAVHKYGRELGARVTPIYGGQPAGRQISSIKRGVDVIVATPGRALDLMNRGVLKLGGLRLAVLDEADEMLDMGFAEDIESILEGTPDGVQTVLFSATMPPRLEKMTRRHLADPVSIEIARPKTAEGDAPLVRQTAYLVQRAHKAAALGRVLDVEEPTAAIVFCRTRAEVDGLTDTLNGRGYRAEALHGGLTQDQRDKVMGRLRAGSSELLVATDVAARGLDIDQLTHVVNFDVPAAPEAYVHRIGRVGRAGREGVAITLAEPREHRQLKTIERLIKQKIPVEKVPTVADLQVRRLEATRAALHESLLEDDLTRFRVVVETLADEFDLMEVALAAVKLAHEARAGSEPDEQDIPEIAPRPEWKSKAQSAPYKGKGGAAKPGRGPQGPATRIFIGAGREKGIRPQDLVGAITGESRLGGKDIGSIQISDRFSLVELPADAADEVIAALRGSTIKGKKTTVRREKF
ncbi:MAG: DEAD/DEAH box helicase [Solirubrobacterales bacterium]|nr:DEAD/DEAH box helicase [Solirubrobacterales bacterium]